MALKFKLRQYRCHVEWLVHKYTRGLYKPRFLKGSQRYLYDEVDGYQYSSTEVSDDDFVFLEFLTAIEIYTSADIDKLIKRLERYSKASQYSWRELHLQAKKQRRSLTSGGWSRIGQFARRGSNYRFSNFIPSSNLPAFVEYADAQIFFVTPSITAIAVTFWIKDDFKLKQFSTIRLPYQPYKSLNRDGSVSSNHRRKLQKDAAKKVLLDFGQQIRKWLNAELPGLSAREKSFEIAMHQTYRFPSGKLDSFLNYNGVSRAMEIASPFNHWVSDDFPDFAFVLDSMRRSEGFAWTAAAYSETYEGQRSDELDRNFKRKIDEMVKPFLILKAFYAALDGYVSKLSNMRDSLNTKRRNPISVKEITRMVSDDVQRADFQLLINDLLKFDDYLLRAEGVDLKSAKAGHPVSLKGTLMSSLEDKTQQAGKFNQEVSKLIETRASLLASLRSAHLQTAIVGFAFISSLAAILTLWLSLR